MSTSRPATPPSPPPRLVATDLDGTLVRSDGTVSPGTREVLRQLDDLGVPVVFVTGRPLRWARDVFDHVGGHGLAVVANGALVWDVAGDRPRLERALPAEVAVQACEDVRAAVPGTAFAVETLAGISLEPSFRERYAVPDGSARAPLADLFARPVYKVLARHEQLGPQEFWDAAAEVVGDRMTITWSSSSSLLEISAAGVTKASTLSLLCAERGVASHEVIAFGDMPNDLPMLGWAGTSYAMANAHPTVVEAAAHLAPSHDDDGVAHVLRSTFGLDR